MKWNGNVVSSGVLKILMVLYRVMKFVKQGTNNNAKQFIFSCSTIIPKIVFLTVSQVHQNSQQILLVFWFCGYVLLIVLLLNRIFGSILLKNDKICTCNPKRLNQMSPKYSNNSFSHSCLQVHRNPQWILLDLDHHDHKACHADHGHVKDGKHRCRNMEFWQFKSKFRCSIELILWNKYLLF